MRWYGVLGIVFGVVWQSSAWAKEPPAHTIQYRTEDCKTNENSRSCAWMGAYLERKGKRKEARPYYKKACLALIRPLGSACYLWGLVEKKQTISRQAYQRACKLKDPDGCTALGELYSKQGELAKALILYRKGCVGKDGRGCHRVAQHLIKKKWNKQALRMMLKACTFGYPPGCGYLGWFYETKKHNKKKALLLYSYGCKLRGSVACARLGFFLWREKKHKQARKYLRLSCRLGFQRACQRLHKLTK